MLRSTELPPPPAARVGSERGGQQRLLRAVMSKRKGKQQLDRWSIIPTEGMAGTGGDTFQDLPVVEDGGSWEHGAAERSKH